MSNITIPPLSWEYRPGNINFRWHADVFEGIEYSVVGHKDQFYAMRHGWTGPVRLTAWEAKDDAEADYQKTIKRLLKIE